VLGIDDLSSGRLSNLSAARSSSAGKLSFHRTDIRSSGVAELIERHRPEVVFHLAAQVDVRRSIADPVRDAMVNVVGTLNLLQACAHARVRKLVFASSGGCIYGEPDDDRLPVTEDQVHRPEAMPESPYGVSKKVVLDYLRYFKAVPGLDFTALALSNVYGPRQEPAGEAGLEGQVVAIFCRRMLARRPCTIYGDGTQTRDFVYVADVVEAFAAARDGASGELVNVGTGRELSVNELHAKLAAKTGLAVEPSHAPTRPGELRRSVVDPSKAAAVLGWTPRCDLDEGLEETVAWFKANPA
jgi:UDP-glucose 4-epimerase